MPSGTIIKGIGGFYYVKTSEGIYECKARGVFRKDSITPLTGDSVDVSVTDDEKRVGSLDTIHPRRSQLIRPAVANVDQMAVVIAARSPLPDLMLLDKLLITAEIKNIEAVICINKADLDEAGEYKSIETAYSKAGYRVIALSSVLDKGYDALENILAHKVTAFAGQSGVGKSTILNRIMKSMVMQTGNISERLERGKHTTRHAELLELCTGGFIVDTPGFSSFGLPEMPSAELEGYYPEFAGYLGKCKFTGCSHISEPGCSVKAALDEGLIDSGRYARYTELYSLLKNADREYGKTKIKKQRGSV